MKITTFHGTESSGQKFEARARGGKSARRFSLSRSGPEINVAEIVEFENFGGRSSNHV